MIIVGVQLLLCIADFCGRHLRPILTSCGLDMLNWLQANSGDAKFNSFEVALKPGIAECHKCLTGIWHSWDTLLNG